VTTNKEWLEAQAWEKDWHGNAVNSYFEEMKQFIYAKRMGLKTTNSPKTPYRFQFNEESILDVGGGGYSLLLKCEGFSRAVVIDPLEHHDWVYARYDACGIEHILKPAEELDKVFDLKKDVFDEVWFYNVLEHVYDPEKIVKNVLGLGKIVRVFEWIDTYVSKGHPNILTEADLNKWLGGVGKVEVLSEGYCRGKAYYGIFKGNHYE
jgi:2-polyprenyl-3-methyl-5-hydroxy-6-metoxy-1,4-benzoquinol methylase